MLLAAWVSLSLAAAGCGGGVRQAGDAENFNVPEHDNVDYGSGEQKPRKARSSEAAAGSAESGELARLSSDQREQIKVALSRGDRKAKSCIDVEPETPKGEGEVRVVFDGKKGKSTDAIVGAPWAGTKSEACIKNSYKNEVIVPFSGPPIEVAHKVTIGENAKQ